MTDKFLEKVNVQFKNNYQLEWTSFLNILENLSKHHFGKATKKSRKHIGEKDHQEFSVFILKHLLDKEFIHGEFLEYLLKESQYNSFEQMVKANKVTVNLEMLSKAIIKPDPIEKNEEYDISQYSYQGTINEYRSVSYSIISNLAKRNFYHEEGSKLTYRGFTKTIKNLLKNYYNSSNIPEKIKMLIKNDSKLKFFIAHLLKKMGIWRIKDKEFIMSKNKKEMVAHNFSQTSKEELLFFLKQEITLIEVQQ